MRPVLHGDVSNAARALLAVPLAQRADLCRRLIVGAECADLHVRRTGRVHKEWGNGSLMAAARTQALAPEPSFDDAAYCACFELVLGTLRLTRMRS